MVSILDTTAGHVKVHPKVSGSRFRMWQKLFAGMVGAAHFFTTGSFVISAAILLS